MDCSSQPGSSVHGISQAIILEWVAVSFSRNLPNSGIKPTSPALTGEFFTTEPPGKSQVEGETRIKKEQNGMIEGGKLGRSQVQGY